MMRYPRKWQLAFVCLLALALLPLAPARPGTAQAPGYIVTDLGTLGSGAGLESRAFGLDECGRVVGESQTGADAPGPYHPFYWDGTTLTDLGTLGGSTGVATALNQGGTVVGSSLTSGSLLHPFVRPTGGPMQDIGTLGGFSAEAQDVNAAGQVVGQTEDGSFQDRAFVWQEGAGMHALTAPWGTPIRAYGINDAGQIAGSANLPSSGTHAFVTIGGVAVDLGTLGGSVSVATEVNDPGEVVGYSFTPIPPNTITQFFHAFRWKDLNGNGQSDSGEMIDLGLLAPAHKYSYAYDVNNAGQVVGASETGTSASGSRAFVWQDVNANNLSDPGEMQDLNNVVVSVPGWTFREARDINNRGQIVGTGLNPDGKVHAFLLTPTNVAPSPCDPTPTPTPVPGTLQFTAATYTVAESGGSVVVSVGRTGGIDGTVTVNYATSNGTAAQPGDYTSASGTLTFAPGETTKTFSVNINDDTLDESDETVNLSLNTPGGGATLGPQSTATLTITDNDAQPTVQFSAATYSAAENAGGAFITVTRTGGSNGGVTVNYATSNGTAAAGSDYTAASGTLTFSEGELSKTFNVFFNEDALDEPDKSVNLTLSAPSGGALGAQTTAVLTITDDDATPTLKISRAVTATEGNTGSSPATTARFVVTLTGASAQTVTVLYNTVDGSATQPGDYASKSGTVTYAPGETGAKNIDISVVGDTADEPNETFAVSLSSPTNATFAVTPDDTFGIGTITDDDGTPSLNINDVTVTEGNAGTTAAATFTVSLLPASGQTVTVNYATANGTATTASSDYAAASGTLTFAPGETSKPVTVNVTGDATPEAHENFVVNLSSPSNAELGDPQGQGTILNDDTTLSINDLLPGINEGNSGGTDFVFTVSLSHVSAVPVRFDYATADDTATVNHDYIRGNATLEIPAGSTSASIRVLVVGDNTFENNEEFVVNLSNAFNAVITAPQGRARILNDEAASLFQISGGPNSPNFSISEGGGTATFTITRTGSTAGGVTVNYATSNGTATAGSDYTVVSGAITFAEGDMSETFDVPILNDTLDEPDETVSVSLTAGFGASSGTGSSVTLKIVDDDAPPTFQFTNSVYGLPENGLPENSTGSVTITVTRDGGTNAASVNYATSNGTATGADYETASGTLTFAANEVVKTFNIKVTNDTLDEANETVNLALSSPGGGGVLGSPNTATLTIMDDDDPPTVSVSDAVAVNEGNSGATNAAFSVTLSAPSGQTVTVNVATLYGSATAGSDYTAVGPTLLTFNPGQTSQTVNVTVLDDTLDEPDETFNVTLSSPSNATLNDDTGVGTITDNDEPPTIQFSSSAYSLLERLQSGNPAAVTVTVTRTGSSNAVSVNYATSNGTATEGSDYTAAVGTLTFAEGVNSATFTIANNDDALDEPNETVNLALSSPGGGATLGSQSTAVYTIVDNDEPPTISVADTTVTEGSTGTSPATNATFTVKLSAPSGQTVSMLYQAINGTATQPADFAVTDGTLTFSPGETEKTVTVAVVGDTTSEADETFSLVLFNPTNAGFSDGTAVATIADDDATPSLSINDAPTVPELDIGGGVARFTVTLSAASGQTVTVNYATANGTASGTDYTPTSGTLTFAPGDTSEEILVSTSSDNFDEEDEETFFVNLSGATNATIADAQGVGTIRDNDETPKLHINDITITEGDAGTTNATFTVSLGPSTGRTVTVDYATANRTAVAGSDYTATSGTLTFTNESSKTITVQVTGDTVNEANESFYVILSNPTNAFILDTHGECFVTNDDAPALRFSQAAYPVGESAHFVTVTVTRAGDASTPVGVDFATSDGTATERRDYTAVSGSLQFAAGETSKTFDVLLTEDSYQEAEETINLTLSNPTGGATLGSQPTATVNVAADDTTQPQPNPIDESSNFVRQHYHDFLNREPDASGLAFWTQEIEGCGADAACREAKRINVSAAFFLSIEFQQTGYLVYRTYKAAYGDATSPGVEGTVPVVRLQEFLPDTRRIGQGVVVGEPDWEQKLQANKNAYMAEFVQRQRFLSAFPTSLTAAQFVDKLNQNAGGVLTQGERDQLVAALSPDPASAAARAGALRSVAENAALQQQEFTRAFVLMQYYGYLRRNPDDAPDSNFAGWKFWLTKLNEANGNFVAAEMVKAFLDSIEYRTRFAP